MSRWKKIEEIIHSEQRIEHGRMVAFSDGVNGWLTRWNDVEISVGPHGTFPTWVHVLDEPPEEMWADIEESLKS